MADVKHANDTNLDTFLEDIFAKFLIFSQSNLEVQVVHQLVHEMVNNIVKEAYSPDSGLTAREVIPVGSMAENTRVRQPDEFDFMVVVDKFNVDDITSVESSWNGTSLTVNPNCRREKCAYDLRKPGLFFDDIETDENSQCDCNSALLDREMKLFKMIRKAVYKMAKDGQSCSLESVPGRLRMTDDSTTPHGPAITFKLLWEKHGVGDELKTMEISVDLVPVIELTISPFLLDRLDIFHQDYYKKLRDTNKVHMIIQKGAKFGLFRVSFALAESQLIRDESETHRKCYMLMKYVYRTNDSCLLDSFSSFVFKNLVLQHSVQCEGGKLGTCLLKILGDLKDKLDEEGSKTPFVPYIFSTGKNLLHNSDLEGMWTDQRQILSQFIENLEKFRDGSPIPSSFQFSLRCYSQSLYSVCRSLESAISLKERLPDQVFPPPFPPSDSDQGSNKPSQRPL